MTNILSPPNLQLSCFCVWERERASMCVFQVCVAQNAAFKRLTEEKKEGGLTGKLQIKDDEKRKRRRKVEQEKRR